MPAIDLKCMKTLFALMSRPMLTQRLHCISSLDPNVESWVLREDLRHHIVSGNKWHKLYFHLQAAALQKVTSIATAGGYYSNHMHALAWVGQYLNIETHGIERGERPETLNPTLKDVINWGMKLHFISRSDYRDLREEPWRAKKWVGEAYWIPEGGNDWKGLNGAIRFGTLLNGYLKCTESHQAPFDYILLGCGTAVTLCGLVLSSAKQTEVIGISAFKGSEYLKAEIDRKLLITSNLSRGRWRLMTDFHFGGFGRVNTKLRDFDQSVRSSLPFRLESVYTLKAFYALCYLLINRYFRANSRVLFIHTGGLQGNRGYSYN